MVRNKARAGQQDVEEEEDKPSPHYLVDADEAAARGRALPMLVASRRCYTCRDADEDKPVESTDAQPYIERIAEHCATTPDYVLPDTPLKEAIFRVMLAGSNEPKTAQDISEVLSEKWELTAYPRDVSPRVIQRVLDSSQAYGIARLPEPEPEEEPEPEAEPEEPSAEETESTDEASAEATD